MAKDPVCGMDVDEKRAPATADYQGQRYFFCRVMCRAAFQRDPERYVAADRPGEGKPSS